MRVLRARLHQMAMDEAAAEAKEARASQVRTVDRSERIRTYNFPENRISDHRTGFKANRLDAVLDGDLDAVVDSAVQADEEARLAALAGDGGDLPSLGGGRGNGHAHRCRGADPATRRPAPGCPRAGLRPRRGRAPHAPGRRPRRSGRTATPGARRGARRPGAAAAPHRDRPLPPARAARRAGRLRAAPRDRAGRRPRARRDRRPEAPVVVDLCTGSGALALGVADEAPGAEVTAVELSELAVAWAARNIEATGLPVRLVAADATADPATVPELAELVGRVDVVVSNPPYIPVGMVPLEPEVAEHDPQVALYGGSADGLAIPLAVAATAARLLHPGGLLVMEHADSQGESLPRALSATGDWADTSDHADLARRPRTTTARRS